ncbi:predicted protein [Histoplasma capsulatum var. duboisii H88]|uniref:Predicted protein n=1 Tax=Ajellomyces capsulatus (strain H88) TaxID=544711 RepID=F0UC24_AJEC8|nr:predicted protein [Histoplasma capsulatum var. duboisii H88]
MDGGRFKNASCTNPRGFLISSRMSRQNGVGEEDLTGLEVRASAVEHNKPKEINQASGKRLLAPSSRRRRKLTEIGTEDDEEGEDRRIVMTVDKTTNGCEAEQERGRDKERRKDVKPKDCQGLRAEVNLSASLSLYEVGSLLVRAWSRRLIRAQQGADSAAAHRARHPRDGGGVFYGLFLAAFPGGT